MNTPSQMQMKSDFAIVGCGVLGTSLCRQLLKSPEFGSRIVTGITKTTNNHENIRNEILSDSSQSDQIFLQTADEAYANSESHKFKDVVFCAPPSGFDDYPGAVEEAITKLWEGPNSGGSFVFTSSGGIFEAKGGETVTETSPTADPIKNPRAARLIQAEKRCIQNGGTILRLSGLYTLERGAHNYWLEKVSPDEEGNIKLKGREDGIVNLLHYDDAANAAMTAIFHKSNTDDIRGKIFLISDGNPTTRKGICESAMKAARYKDKKVPIFEGGDSDDMGKIYDSTWTNDVLKWKPVFASSFEDFMASNKE